jgi:formamidopyrimidine-DNA glycosylase
MSGQFLIQPKAALDERHLRARFDLGRNDLRFIDQRTFGWVGVEERINNRPTCVQHIAADPFDSEFDLQETISRFLKKKTEIKRALLDQSVMSGVGNIMQMKRCGEVKCIPKLEPKNWIQNEFPN